MDNFLLDSLKRNNIFSAPSLYGPAAVPMPSGGMGTPPFQQEMPAPRIQFPQSPIPSIGIEQPTPVAEDDDIIARLNQIYTPETRMSDALAQHIDAMPTRPKPGVMAKIAASLIGAGAGPEAADKALFGNYYRDVDDWKQRLGGLQVGANLERFSNANERQLAHNVLTNELNTRKQTAKEKVDTERLRIAQQRADTYDFKARNPHMRIVMPKGGNVLAVNPQTGEVAPITDADGKPIPTGSLSDADRIALQHSNALEQIGARGDEARETEGVRQTNRKEIEEIEQGYTRENIQTREQNLRERPAKATTKEATPAAQARARVNRAQEYIARNPDAADFIKINGLEVTLDAPSSGAWYSSGPDAKKHKEALDYIFGAAPDATKNATTPAPKTPSKPVGTPQMQMHPNATRAATAPPGTPIGTTKTFPNGNVGRWDGTGWVLVK